MIRFECDYNTGAHPAILQRLLETNEEQTPGYGEDPYCESARKKIRALCQNETVDVHFLMGGSFIAMSEKLISVKSDTNIRNFSILTL